MVASTTFEHVETMSSCCRVARQGFPCYTAAARLGFKPRASAVLKSKIIRSTEFGTAVHDVWNGPQPFCKHLCQCVLVQSSSEIRRRLECITCIWERRPPFPSSPRPPHVFYFSTITILLGYPAGASAEGERTFAIFQYCVCIYDVL